MTYVVLSVAVLAGLVLVCLPALRHLPLRPLVLTAVALVALTAVFDNVIVGLHIVAYDDAKIAGVLVPIAPIEDFAYALGAILLVPAVWTWLGRSASKERASEGRVPRGTVPNGSDTIGSDPSGSDPNGSDPSGGGQ